MWNNNAMRSSASILYAYPSYNLAFKCKNKKLQTIVVYLIWQSIFDSLLPILLYALLFKSISSIVQANKQYCMQPRMRARRRVPHDPLVN